ncbi:glycine N-acyltransferase-like protein 2 [Vombatus ursinus]|uniref:glycine N-acyltransferase-like protein 2 n=1 Tax=Vombatus ursinus TaxID=29139 RepID=UPI000FFD0893|nr:glycine N-acyltransferase-like protein 2 [Vombatus ursinus]
MIRLHEAKMLQTLHRSLTKSIPEAMNVYGSIFLINRGNPFNVEMLVDSWSDYHTVITRPQKQRSSNVFLCSANDNFRPSLLDVSHAELGNSMWKYGQNERSLRFIRRCLQNFPGYCLLGPEGSPISWIIMEQTSEWRMAYTLPEYRVKGLSKQVISAFMQYLQNAMPVYAHVEETNENSHRLMKSCGLHAVDCGWHEWKCMPAKIL